jgi:hypothetical protein
MRQHGSKASRRLALVERALKRDAGDGYIHFRDRFDWSKEPLEPKTISITNVATGQTLTFYVSENE